MNGVTTVAYLMSGVLFIRSLGGLSKQETAARGNLYGMLGMALAVAVAGVTWFMTGAGAVGPGMALLIGSVVVGGAVGVVLARRVEMTGMPELVAILHSFVGLAAVLVGISSYLAPRSEHAAVAGGGAAHVVAMVEIWVGVAVGALTFTGSIIAWAKLRGTLSGKPLLLPGRHLLNAGIAAGIIGLAVPFVNASGPGQGLIWLLLMTVLAGALGIHLVMAIGGADMPVVVSLLNSYSGWAAAAAGFVLANDLLIVTGALVGASGAILSIIMCRAMNRSILNVVFGGFGTGDVKPSEGPRSGEVRELSVDETAARLRTAKSVIIVPGYGMAVARAQNAVQELTRALREQGVTVRFAIHPVAGRLPGHMNVLLAEAGVPYDVVLEMEHINHDFTSTDAVLVIGANDIVNPGALDDASSPIYGMPVLEVWKSKLVVVLKRGMAAGYAGVDNPLFLLDNTRMLFGDARKSIEALLTAVRK
ncbi:NAD(P)(+) transhydrogenase (Re/Si-specific) subunit beta [Hyalangium rubrum]|uniref:NAD(P) transhydrogenase subunit beta n=1 Tax=Hyalangium rubrum TaxID=3103134 RepID=A0ABU5HC70_9BACT|nr:NAD(P)(+) transhydrogenase (Re/Si-specific) subunit beta [Hyalangium sp. s54d21]MDY7231050.1 NAD(P)(+) transhydrogenase (Re/Si-specific) subunit beta [Hyalangium sp. s54d21]